MMYRTGLDVDNPYMNTFLPTKEEYVDNIRQQIQNNSVIKVRQLHAEKQSEKAATEQITQFFKTEQQRIKEFEDKKRQKYKGELTHDISERQRQKVVEKQNQLHHE